MALFPVKSYLPGTLVQDLVEAGKEGDGGNGRCQNITDRLGEKDGEVTGYRAEIMLEKATYEEWFDGSFTKTICGAKNRNQLLKAKTIAEELGLVENKDFFLIRDACHTELEPEEFDENGEGMTLTCIGFRPLPDEIAHQISHKFHLY